MDYSKIKKTVRDAVTVERAIVVVGTLITYTYVMGKFDYRMVRPAYVTDTLAVFNRPFAGTTAVRLEK